MSREKDGDVQFLVDHLQRQPDSILFARLADIYLRTNRVGEAIRLCEEGIKKYPYYVTGHLVLGKSYLANKMYDQAEKEFKRVLLLDSKYLSAHKLYGDLMQEIGWENTCEMSYKKILQIDPLDEVARSRVGEYILQGESELDDADYLASHTATADIDIESMTPISDSADEEELLFKDDDTEETVAQFDDPEQEVVDSKEEEFSSILDDIFKDEVVQHEATPPLKSSDTPSADEDLVTEIQRDPDSYLPKVDTFDAGVKQPGTEIDEKFDDFGEHEVPSEHSSLNRMDFSNQEPVQDIPFEFPKRKSAGEEKIVTPTLGEIYAAQGQYAKAINVFELLLKKHPENETFAKKITILKRKLEESKNAPKD